MGFFITKYFIPKIMMRAGVRACVCMCVRGGACPRCTLHVRGMSSRLLAHTADDHE